MAMYTIKAVGPEFINELYKNLMLESSIIEYRTSPSNPKAIRIKITSRTRDSISVITR